MDEPNSFPQAHDTPSAKGPLDSQTGYREVGISPSALKAELEITIESALMLAEPGTSPAKLARRIYQQDYPLISQFAQTWIEERLAWIICRRQRAVATVHQLVLPGFDKIPRRLIFADGSRKRLHGATLKELKQYRTLLWKQQDKQRNTRLEPLDRLIALVSTYNANQPGITVNEVISQESKRLENKSVE